MRQKPVFYDTTLRDGNQSLKKPWGLLEKEIIFKKLIELNIPVIEVGFPASSEIECETCRVLAHQAPDEVTISVLARAVDTDIKKAAEVLEGVMHPRIQLFLAMNPVGLKYVLHKNVDEAIQMALRAVKLAKSLLPIQGEVSFAIEQFGDCWENLADVLRLVNEVVNAGVDIVVLANTVERTHPFAFVEMLKKVVDVVRNRAQLSVHCHNDLGMATATTVESFFAGATQLETTINGIGERCGNTNMFEVAMALHNSDVKVDLNMKKFYEVACLVSEMSGINIWDKAPLIGKDCFVHRSGVHQDGANKTKGLAKGQYIPYRPELIGRVDGEHLAFTSQSGSAALQSICCSVGYPLSSEQVLRLLPKAKELAQVKGELSSSDVSQLCLHNG